MSTQFDEALAHIDGLKKELAATHEKLAAAEKRAESAEARAVNAYEANNEMGGALEMIASLFGGGTASEVAAKAQEYWMHSQGHFKKLGNQEQNQHQS